MAATTKTGKLTGTKSERLIKIEAEVGNTPRTTREIADAAGVEKAVYNHLRTMLGKGLVKRTDDGWVIAAPKVAKKRDRKAEKARREAKLAAANAS